MTPGQGAIVRRGLEKLAAYRDDQGTLHLNSAACSHVGCYLHWNGFEVCWDCPCHGSMFEIDGNPINAESQGNVARLPNRMRPALTNDKAAPGD
ncbi:Rieske 2Fe-2S domain-containing protein [Bradyrhizobium sp. CCGB20]|uniref:Rieske 2Fe-2S domain-containing protein n=1 Tax=unclassified Bradyrhizobium TaxID=2631580 RepID=UPI0035C734E8